MSRYSDEDWKFNSLSEKVSNILRDVTVDKLETWSGVRSDTIDHLPMSGPIQDGSYFEREYEILKYGTTRAKRDGVAEASYISGYFCLTGLGARGFQASFILSDLITSMISGRALAMDEKTINALVPSRFQIRDLIKKHVT